MPNDIKIGLAADGFPWLSLLLGIVASALITVTGLALGFPWPGVSVVAALSALAVFAMTLGWRVKASR